MSDQPKSPPQVPEWAIDAALQIIQETDTWIEAAANLMSPGYELPEAYIARIITRHFTLAQPRSEEVLAAVVRVKADMALITGMEVTGLGKDMDILLTALSHGLAQETPDAFLDLIKQSDDVGRLLDDCGIGRKAKEQALNRILCRMAQERTDAGLVEFVKDVAEHGLRFDLMPTHDLNRPEEFWHAYIRRADEVIRERAANVLTARSMEGAK